MAINNLLFENTIKNYSSKIRNERDKQLNSKFLLVKKAYEEAKNKNDYRNVELYSFMHEIKTYFLLKERLKNVKIGNDLVGDFDFETEFFIAECTTMTRGENNEIQELKFGVYDYPKNEFASRILSLFKEKRKQYYKWTKRNNSENQKPFILFINSGMLNDQIIESPSDSTTALLSLYGVGDAILYFDNEKSKGVGSSYKKESEIVLKDGKKIQVNLFDDSKYKFISAVCFCLIGFGEEYDSNNFKIFPNPNASNLLKFNEFDNEIFDGTIKTMF